MTNKEYANEILDVIGNVTIADDAIYQLAYDVYLKLGGEESQVTLDTIYKELKATIDIWDNTGDLEISENGIYELFGKQIIVNVSCGSIPIDEIWYTSSDGNIVTPWRTSALPEIVSNTYVNGKGIFKFKTNVTSIGNYAFSGCSSLTSVTIPNSVKSIGNYAFYNCTGLTSVTIPNSVTSIGDWAFELCRGLTSVIIPDRVTSIGNSAFWQCFGLTSVTIGNSVKSIGANAFNNCTSLTSVTIPNSVTNIGDWAFYLCSSLTSIEIPNSVTEIKLGTFYGCYRLTSVTIPNSVTSIGENAFRDCTGLTSISYTGTIAQYNAITKGLNWRRNVPATVVHCTDGDVAI